MQRTIWLQRGGGIDASRRGFSDDFVEKGRGKEEGGIHEAFDRSTLYDVQPSFLQRIEAEPWPVHAMSWFSSRRKVFLQGLHETMREKRNGQA